jgi:hypothetical protein
VIWLLIALAIAVLAIGALVVLRRSSSLRPARPAVAAPGEGRILFPFLGASISRRTLDATLRLAHAQEATLVPAYIETVPRTLPLDAPLRGNCEVAMPLLETIEQHAAEAGVAVDSRIETGRTARHALRRLIGAEPFDRLVVPAATATSEGFEPEDVAWLLEIAPGEVLVLRPTPQGPAQPASGRRRQRTGQPSRRGLRRAGSPAVPHPG